MKIKKCISDNVFINSGYDEKTLENIRNCEIKKLSLIKNNQNRTLQGIVMIQKNKHNMRMIKDYLEYCVDKYECRMHRQKLLEHISNGNISLLNKLAFMNSINLIPLVNNSTIGNNKLALFSYNYNKTFEQKKSFFTDNLSDGSISLFNYKPMYKFPSLYSINSYNLIFPQKFLALNNNKKTDFMSINYQYWSNDNTRNKYNLNSKNSCYTTSTLIKNQSIHTNFLDSDNNSLVSYSYTNDENYDETTTNSNNTTYFIKNDSVDIIMSEIKKQRPNIGPFNELIHTTYKRTSCSNDKCNNMDYIMTRYIKKIQTRLIINNLY